MEVGGNPVTQKHGLLKHQWGLYKNGKLVLVHGSKEMLEGNLREFIKNEGPNQSHFEIKPYTVL